MSDGNVFLSANYLTSWYLQFEIRLWKVLWDRALAMIAGNLLNDRGFKNKFYLNFPVILHSEHLYLALRQKYLVTGNWILGNSNDSWK